MLNQLVFVGRVKSIEKLDDEVKLTIEVKRTFKNADGEYEADIIPISLYEGMAENTLNYLTTNDIVGIKGRIENNNNSIQIKAEKITFLTNSEN